MKSKLPPDALGRELILEFFWRFSVFECALKREGFLKSDRYGNAAPDWEEFGKNVVGKFAHVTVPRFVDALDELATLAPRRQVVRGDVLEWKAITKQAGDTDECYLLDLLKTARNNLFHGGKYPDGSIDEIAHDRAILRAGIVILDGLCEIHEGVRRWTEEAA